MGQVQEKTEQRLCSLYDSLVHMFVSRLRLKYSDLVSSSHSVTKAFYIPSFGWMTPADLADYLLCVHRVSLALRGLCTY